jgi:phosphinothricin acetyltransferase
MDKSEKIILRPFIKADVAAICKIYAYYVENSAVTFELDAPSQDEIFEKFSEINNLAHPIIIAQIDERVIGFAYASTFRPRAAYRFTAENAIYIDKRMHGKGLGSMLLAELLKQSKAYGFNQMVAIITAGTDASIALHEKYGFEILGRLPELGYKFEKWHDIIHMQKKL